VVCASKLSVVDTVGVGEDNLGKGVECLQWFGHEGEDMASSFLEVMKLGVLSGDGMHITLFLLAKTGSFLCRILSQLL